MITSVPMPRLLGLAFLSDPSQAPQLAGIAGQCPAPLPEPAAVAVFAGDHGVHAQGVTPWPQEVTAQMVANFMASTAVQVLPPSGDTPSR